MPPCARTSAAGRPPRSVYLAVGLSRSYQGQYWPIVAGVHLLPDYDVTVDARQL